MSKFRACSTQVTTVPELADRKIIFPTSTSPTNIILRLGSKPAHKNPRRLIKGRFSKQELLWAIYLKLSNQKFDAQLERQPLLQSQHFQPRSP